MIKLPIKNIQDIEAWSENRTYSGMFKLNSFDSLTLLQQKCSEHDIAFFLLKGENFSDKAQFLTYAETVFQFPDYYGENWDAFEECLQDFSWMQMSGSILLYEHWQIFSQHSSEAFDTLLDILKSTVEYWENQGKPMLVLLAK